MTSVAGYFADRANGTRIGCDNPMLTRRGRDRRQALADLLSALTRALDRQSDISLMRGAFEQMMRRLVPVRTIQVREIGSRWGNRTDANAGTESIALDVPGSDGAAKYVLEATFDPASGLGEWDFQMLGVGAQLAALVVEIERSRLQLTRAGLLDAVRVRREKVAPLIGSTPPMHALRASID